MPYFNFYVVLNIHQVAAQSAIWHVHNQSPDGSTAKCHSPDVSTVTLLLNVYSHSPGGSTFSLLLNVYNHSPGGSITVCC